MKQIKLNEEEAEYLISLLEERYYKLTNLSEMSMINRILTNLGKSPNSFILSKMKNIDIL